MDEKVEPLPPTPNSSEVETRSTGIVWLEKTYLKLLPRVSAFEESPFCETICDTSFAVGTGPILAKR